MSLFDSFKRVVSSNSKSLSDMSDRELARDLERGKGRNTGESVATRAHKIMEAEKRGIDINKKSK